MTAVADLYFHLSRADSDIIEHLPHFVDLCVEHDATTVIELGVRTAVSTVAWLHGLEQTDGHLWSVDINPAPTINTERWTFIQGDDLAADVLEQLPTVADIVFIDTSHHYLRTRDELETYVRRVRSGGLIVLHDTELERPDESPAGDPPFPVKTAVTEFCDRYGFAWANNPACWGLATIQVA